MTSLRSIRKRFFLNTLTDEDLEQVKVLKGRIVEIHLNSPQYGGIHNVIDGFGKLYHNGVAKSLLCSKSKKIMREQNIEVCVCDLLVLKPSGKLWEELLEGGFYHFNPERKKPDSVISFKVSVV